jgi:hypothetical protein
MGCNAILLFQSCVIIVGVSRGVAIEGMVLHGLSDAYMMRFEIVDSFHSIPESAI